MIKAFITTCAINLSGLFAIASPIDTVQSKTFTFKNVADTTLQLTVFYPKITPGKKPVMILFHGGAWRIGNRKIMFPICEYFADRGLVTVSASYRLIKDGSDIIKGKETCIKDAKSAIRWVKEHANELNIDTNKIILGGASAGGHLATMAALDVNINEASDNKFISTKAQVLTLFNPAYSLNEDQLVQPFRFDYAKVPPLIMFFGTDDNLRIPAKSFLQEVKNKNIKTEIWFAPQQKHAFFNREEGWRKSMCLKTDEFLVTLDFLKPTINKITYPDNFIFSSQDN